MGVFVKAWENAGGCRRRSLPMRALMRHKHLSDSGLEKCDKILQLASRFIKITAL